MHASLAGPACSPSATSHAPLQLWDRVWKTFAKGRGALRTYITKALSIPAPSRGRVIILVWVPAAAVGCMPVDAAVRWGNTAGLGCIGLQVCCAGGLPTYSCAIQQPSIQDCGTVLTFSGQYLRGPNMLARSIF
jgi:hypothetical protein